VIAFQPLEIFCTTQRKNYEPLMERVEQLNQTLVDLIRRLPPPE
jgi:hypothetical protein